MFPEMNPTCHHDCTEQLEWYHLACYCVLETTIIGSMYVFFVCRNYWQQHHMESLRDVSDDSLSLPLSLPPSISLTLSPPLSHTQTVGVPNFPDSWSSAEEPFAQKAIKSFSGSCHQMSGLGPQPDPRSLPDTSLLDRASLSQTAPRL